MYVIRVSHKLKMKKFLELKMNIVLSFSLIILSINFLFHPNVAFALEGKSSKLIQKISKDYTNKFCNSIAFGLSKESGMKFSIEEYKKVFEKRKGISDINEDELAEEIANLVIDKCGYPLELSGEKGVEEFKIYYLTINKEL